MSGIKVMAVDVFSAIIFLWVVSEMFSLLFCFTYKSLLRRRSLSE